MHGIGTVIIPQKDEKRPRSPAGEFTSPGAAREAALRDIKGLHPVYNCHETPLHQQAHVEQLGRAAALFCVTARLLREQGAEEEKVVAAVRKAAELEEVLARAFLRPLWRLGDVLVRCMHAEENTAHRNGIYDAELALERNRVADLRHLREAIAGLSNSEVALEQLGYRREAIRFIALKARLASIRYPEKANGILLKAGREIARLVPNPSLVNPDEIRDKIAARVIRDISEGDMRVDVRGRDIGHFIIQALRPNLVVNPKSGKLHGKPLDLKKREDHIYHTVDCTELILAWPKIYDNPVTLAITATPCKADPEDIRAMARLM